VNICIYRYNCIYIFLPYLLDQAAAKDSRQILENQKLKTKSMKDIINMYYHYFQTEEFDGDENIDDIVITKDIDKSNTSKSYTDKSSTHKSNTDKSDTNKLNTIKLDKSKSNGTEINTNSSVVSNKPLDTSTKSAEVKIKSTNPNPKPSPNQVKTTSTEKKESSKLVKITPLKTDISPMVCDIPTHRLLLPLPTQVFILIL
jgi:hypothetical protein